MSTRLAVSGQRCDGVGDFGGAVVEKQCAPSAKSRREETNPSALQLTCKFAERKRFSERAVQRDNDVWLGRCCGWIRKEPRDIGRKRHRE